MFTYIPQERSTAKTGKILKEIHRSTGNLGAHLPTYKNSKDFLEVLNQMETVGWNYINKTEELANSYRWKKDQQKSDCSQWNSGITLRGGQHREEAMHVSLAHN